MFRNERIERGNLDGSRRIVPKIGRQDIHEYTYSLEGR